MKVLFVLGTRPGAITMTPIIEVMARRPELFDLRICVTAQADATTAMAAALAGYYRHVAIGHVEAGLRTYDKLQQFPQVPLRNHVNHPAESLQRLAKRLAGTKTQRIVAQTESLLNDAAVYEQMANTANPYGDALAATRICQALLTTIDKETVSSCCLQTSLGDQE